MVVGVPADFESRNQELSNDTKILLQDHFVRFGGKSALYVRTTVSNCKAAKQVSSDKAFGLLNELAVSKNSVVRLTSNLWTKAGLTNGAKGIVRGIIYAANSKPPALPICLIVTFDRYYGPSFIESLPKSVPICPVRREWFSQQKTYSRTMLPLILGYALSIHKLQ